MFIEHTTATRICISSATEASAIWVTLEITASSDRELLSNDKLCRRSGDGISLTLGTKRDDRSRAAAKPLNLTAALRSFRRGGRRARRTGVGLGLLLTAGGYHSASRQPTIAVIPRSSQSRYGLTSMPMSCVLQARLASAFTGKLPTAKMMPSDRSRSSTK